MALGCRQGGRWCGRAPLGRSVLRRRPPAVRVAEEVKAGSPARPYAGAAGGGDEAASGEELLEVCWRRHFLRGGAESRPALAWRAYLSGCHPGFGPLGVALRGNLAAQWWDSALVFREQVFAVDAPLHGPPAAGSPRAGQGLRLLHSETLREALRGRGCSQEPGGPSLEEVLGSAGTLRESLLPGRCLVRQRRGEAVLRGDLDSLLVFFLRGAKQQHFGELSSCVSALGRFHLRAVSLCPFQGPERRERRSAHRMLSFVTGGKAH